MLKFLRNKHHQKKIYIILAAAIIPPFLMWGVSTSEKGSKIPSTVGRIDNKKISLKEYLNSYKAVQHQMAFIYGDKLREAAPKINTKGEAWDRILLLHEAKKERIKTSDTEVVEWISKQPLFQSHGEFDTNIYNLYVNRYLRSNPRDFEEEIRDILTIEKIADNIRSRIWVNESDLKALYLQENSEKDVLYGIASWESEKGNVKVGDEEIAKVYPIVKDKLSEPERVKVSYLFIPKDKEESLKTIFNEKGMTLEALAAKYSVELKEIGYFSKDEAAAGSGPLMDLSPVIFSLAPQKESDWIRLGIGSYKIKIIDKKSERSLTADEAKIELKSIILKQKASEAVIKKMNEIKNKLTGNDLEKTLKDLLIDTQRYSKFKKGSALPGIGPSQAVDSVVASLKEGEVSQAFAAPGGACILKVTKIWPAGDKTYESEKAAFRKKVLDQKISDEMSKLLDKLRNQLKVDLETMRKIFAEEKPAAD